MATPNITLTATLDDLSGQPAGSQANAAKMRICLCGFGPALPQITGTATLARTGPYSIFSSGVQISVKLWGNDQIVPAGTYYSIEILDGEDNVVQCGAYQFTGAPATIDLSNAIQLLPPFNLGFVISTIKYLRCTYIGGSLYQAPGPVLAAAYNGVMMGQEMYTVNGTQIILNFFPETGDRIDAFCIMPT